MGVRLLILVALAGGLALFWVMRSPSASSNTASSGEPYSVQDDVQMLSSEERNALQSKQSLLSERHLDGVEPAEKPQFDVRVEPNVAGGKSQICFFVTEAHGYYVESFRVEFWWTGGKDNVVPEQSAFRRTEYLDNYIKANETLRQCIDLTPYEIDRIGGGMGLAKDWAARIEWHHRARAKNPDPLPVLSR
jgi:hypothetical protein